MRTRAPAFIAVAVFFLAVASVTALAGRGENGLVRLPAASLAGGAGDAAAATSASSSGEYLAAPSTTMAFRGFGQYEVEGTLPDLPSTAPAYRLDSSTTEASVAKLAVAFGLTGDVQAENKGWVARSATSELRVEAAPGLPWYLGPACIDVPVTTIPGTPQADVATVCAGKAAIAPMPSDGGAFAPGPCPPDAQCFAGPVTKVAPTTACDGGSCDLLDAPTCPAEATCVQTAPAIAVAPCPPDAKCAGGSPFVQPERPADSPSKEDAGKLAREVFARLGVDSSGMVVDDGWLTWEARVEDRVDGLPVLGFGTSLSIGAHGAIERASGFLAVPGRIGDYPLVGVEAGLRRLTTGIGALDMTGDTSNDTPPFTGSVPTTASCAGPNVRCSSPGAPSAMPLPEWVPPVQVIKGAHLGLLFTGEVLLPAYLFELDGGGEIPVPAVTDEWLDTKSSTLRK